MGPWALAIDYGTSYTAAAIARDGAVDLLYFNGVPRIPSLVLRNEAGEILVGTTAENETLISPDRVLRAPKRRLGDRVVLVGDAPMSVVDAVAAVLRAVAEEAGRQQGGSDPSRVVMTHPARWGSERLNALTEAARVAGLPPPEFLAEPVAAAIHYLATGDESVPVGGRVAIYDLGGGTFDTAVLEHRADGGFEIVATGGNEYQGGEDFDEVLYRHFGSLIAQDAPETWERLRHSEDRPWRKANAEFRRDVRLLKEDLSTTNSRSVYVRYPVDRELRLTRTQLEELLRPGLIDTLDELAATISRSGTKVEDLSAVYLVGGSSRIRILPQLVRERFGRADTRDDPKAVVTLGAARWLTLARTSEPAIGAAPIAELRHDGSEAPAVPAPAMAPVDVAAEPAAGSDPAAAALATGVPVADAQPPDPTSATEPATAIQCPRCSKQRNGTARYCNGCGYDYEATVRRRPDRKLRLPTIAPVRVPRRSPLVLAGAALAALLVIGVVAVASGAVGIGNEPSPTPDPGTIAASELEVGDCFNDPDRDLVSVERVECSERHTYEVYHEFDITPGSSAYPEEAAFTEEGQPECADEGEQYIGEPLADRNLEALLIVPLEASWRDGDRTLQCALHREDGRALTRSQAQN